MTIARRLYLLIFAAVVGLASLAGLGMVTISVSKNDAKNDWEQF